MQYVVLVLASVAFRYQPGRHRHNLHKHVDLFFLCFVFFPLSLNALWYKRLGPNIDSLATSSFR
jgi:hypothetical protein